MKEKTWLFRILAIVLVAALAGCVDARETNPTAPEETAPPVVETTLPAEIAMGTETSTAPALDDTATPPPPAEETPTQEPGLDLAFPEPEASEALRPGIDLPDLSGAPRYAIEVDIFPDEREFAGKQRVLVSNMETEELESLFFRLLPNGGKAYGPGGLILLTETRVDDISVDPRLSLNDSVIEVPLPASLQPGESVEIFFSFGGKVPLDFGPPGTSGYGIYNYAKEVLSLSGWFPILSVFDDDGWNLDPVSDTGDSVYADTALYHVRLSAPSDALIAATGVAVSEQTEEDRTVYEYVSGPARDFYIILSSTFQVQTQIVDGITVNSYYLPGDEEGANVVLSVAVDSLEIFNRLFGPYPYTELDVVDAPMQYAAGVEFPGVILIGDFLYEQPQRSTIYVATAHEVAHQWWYNVVGNDVFDEPWLDEALTTHSSSLYFEEVHGPSQSGALVASWRDRYQQYSRDGEEYPITAPLSTYEEVEGGAYGAIVYAWGGVFFAELRQEIGDEAFFEALQNYYQAYAFDIARGEDLLAEFEEAAGRELDDFYQEWLY